MKNARPKLLLSGIFLFLLGVALLANAIHDLLKTHDVNKTYGFISSPLLMGVGVLFLVMHVRLKRLPVEKRGAFDHLFDGSPPDPYGITADKIKNPPDIG